MLPLRPGQVERRTHDYKRCGTTSLFAALDVKAGTVIGKCVPRHRAAEFRKFLDAVEANVPRNLDIHVVIDNASSPKTQLIRDWFAKRPRWHVHYTPTSERRLQIAAASGLVHHGAMWRRHPGSGSTAGLAMMTSQVCREPPPQGALRVGCIATMLLLLAGILAAFFFDQTNSDFGDFYLPWWDEILRRGWVDSLRADFSDYSPPYIYLLGSLSLFSNLAGPVPLIKFLSVAFVLVAGWQVYSISRIAQRSRRAALAISVIICCLPEVILNTIVWGQSDIIHTTTLLAFAKYALLHQPAAAMFAAGTAIAVKPQAILAGPVVAYLVLSGFASLRHALMAPLAYLIAMLPATLAGRPIIDLLTLYRDAYGTHLLASAAPNPYVVLQQILPGFTNELRAAGIAAAAGVSLVLLVSFLRRSFPVSPRRLLLMMALTLVLEPYFLPGMHERYFFAGATFTALAALFQPGLTLTAVLLQVVNVLTYLRFFLQTRETLLLAILLMPLPLLLLLRHYRKDSSREEAPSLATRIAPGFRPTPARP